MIKQRCPDCNSDNVAFVELKKDWGMTRGFWNVNTNEDLDDAELAQEVFYYCRDCKTVHNSLAESEVEK